MNEDRFNNYSSVFSWRYGSDEMRALWSQAHKHRLWRRLWVALAEAQAEVGLVSPEQAADLRAHAEQVDVERALEIDDEVQHDLMAGIKAFAEQCPVGGGIIHLGATSTDIEDNTDALRLRQALGLDASGIPVKVVEPYQMLGEIKPDLQDALGVDVATLRAPKTMFGFKNEGWKPWTMFDGTPVLDIKPYLFPSDGPDQFTVAQWVHDLKKT